MTYFYFRFSFFFFSSHTYQHATTTQLHCDGWRLKSDGEEIHRRRIRSLSTRVVQRLSSFADRLVRYDVQTQCEVVLPILQRYLYACFKQAFINWWRIFWNDIPSFTADEIPTIYPQNTKSTIRPENFRIQNQSRFNPQYRRTDLQKSEKRWNDSTTNCYIARSNYSMTKYWEYPNKQTNNATAYHLITNINNTPNNLWNLENKRIYYQTTFRFIYLLFTCFCFNFISFSMSHCAFLSSK